MAQPVQLDGRFVNWMNRLNVGEASLPNCEGSRHHYVPQFLLKRFRGGGRLYELDKQTGEAKETTTKEAAWDKDLYKVVSKSGDHDGVIEGFFSLAEGFASEALDGLVRDGERLTEHDRSDLAFLAAIQEQRAPGFLDELKIMLRHAALTESVVHLTNVKGKRRKEAVETRDAILAGRIMLEPPEQEALVQATQLLVATWLTISILPWTVLKAKPPSPFRLLRSAAHNVRPDAALPLVGTRVGIVAACGIDAASEPRPMPAHRPEPAQADVREGDHKAGGPHQPPHLRLGNALRVRAFTRSP